MRKFNVNVNGKSFAVEVYEVTAGGVVATPVSTIAAPVQAVAAPVAPVKGTVVKSQMPGLVKKLCFAEGATVKAGEPILILEAMKMDTPIVAPCAGTVGYKTQVGANIDTGAVICTIA